MLRWSLPLAGRLALRAGLVLAVLAVNFTLIHAAPGHPAQMVAGEMEGADEVVMASIHGTHGPDKP